MATLAEFIARPGEPTRDTVAVRRRLEGLRLDHGAELVDDLLNLHLSADAVAQRHAVSRNEVRRQRWFVYGLRFEPRYQRWLESDRTQAVIAREFGLAPGTVGEHRRTLRGGNAVIAPEPAPPEADEHPAAPETELGEDLGRVDFDGLDQGTINSGTVTQPITDWTDVFARFNLDPNVFEILGDTVRMSNWQQSKRLENGERDVINLYSYRAQFKRKSTLLTEDIDAARLRAQQWQLPRRIPGTGLGAPVAAVLNLADMQLFKSEGGGVEATLERLYGGLESFQQSVERQRRDRNLNEIVLVNNGDPFEGIAGNYASQPFTVQGNLRAQMNLVLDVWQTFARELFPQFDKAQFVSVLCNHTEFGRQGGAKNSTTGDSDNGSAFLAETLQRILAGRSEFDHVKFTIPHDEMSVYTDAAGVPLAFNHGHKIPGGDRAGFEKWLNGQVRADARAYRAKIWITAHRHHYQSWDLGSAWGFMCPSCDGGSKWLRDTTGAHANSGLLSLLVGEHSPHLWSDVAFHSERAAT